MKKLLLASVLVIASTTAHAQLAFPPPVLDHPLLVKDKACPLNPDISENSPDCWDQSDCADRPKDDPTCKEYNRQSRPEPKPPAQVTPPSPVPPPPPLGWLYGPYTMCADPPRCSMGVVNVPADGLNVRVAPNGPPVMSLVNGTPLIPLQREGDWLLVAAACDLTPTSVWSWTANVPLN